MGGDCKRGDIMNGRILQEGRFNEWEEIARGVNK